MDKIDFKGFSLDLISRRLFVSGKYIYLRNKEFSLLEYFIRNVGKVLSRTRILEDVWDRNILCPTNTVDVHVSSLRKKIKICESANFIKTVPCVGYVFENSY
ncbi:MAG: winged helix-turn-helix domain-containing protein [Candidatus Gracilibacteria bacterium]|jgi:DNA-binding response OmpR family regulator